MIKEGISSRAIGPATPEEQKANHQRYGDMLDKAYDEQEKLDKKLGQRSNRGKRAIASFRAFAGKYVKKGKT